MTAKQVLDKYWDNTAPIDPVTIANRIGISVFRATFPDNISGLIWKNHDKNRVEILVNRTHPETRRRFTIAHELGHFFSVENFDGKIEEKIYTRGEVLSPEEFKANKFAVELLMPKEAVYYFLFKKKYFTIKQLVEVFNVSEMAIVNRLKNLGIIKGL